MRQVRILALLVGLAAEAVCATAVESAPRNYQTIVDRNPFGLRDPESIKPPVQTNNVKAEPPKPKYEIKLTGINTYGGKKKAYFFSKEPNLKNPYFSVTEGEEQKGIEVKEVYVNGTDKWVKVLFNGEEMKMSFKTHGLTNAPTVMPQLGKPGQPGVPNLGVQPGQPGYPQPGMQPIPQPTTVDPNTGLPVAPNSPYTPNNTPRTVPARSLRGAVTQPTSDANADFVTRNPELARQYGIVPGQNQAAAPVQISPEEQFLRMKVNEEMARRSNTPFPPLPGLPGGVPTPQ
ncbi:MAG TPA: hypothetical protein VEH27_12655 [Methylomirabilota bacterium]|nr:hypothetical protein [Methylomirabilota bacterium]